MAISQPAPPRRSRPGIFLALAALALAAIGGGTIFMVRQQNEENRRATEAAAQVAAKRAAEVALEARRSADDEAARKAETDKVSLSVISDPIGAVVEATWKDGAKAAVTPFDFSVPRNAKVHFSFSHKDYQPAAQDVLADATQVVRATLAPQTRAASPVARARSRPERAKPPKDDGEIPLEF